MENKSMTALMSAYARMYHAKYNYKIFDDYLAKNLITKEEQESITENLSEGIKYFNKDFVGTKDEALRWIIDNQISPIMLARSVFAEETLKNEIRLGSKEYLIFASGYDTYAYRTKDNIHVFEIDKKEMIDDKIKRTEQLDKSKVTYIKADLSEQNYFDLLTESGYKHNQKSLSSLLGLSYYLNKEEFKELLQNINKNISDGSGIVFDYPTKEDSVVMDKNAELAEACNEKMKAEYSYKEIEELLSKTGYLIYEYLDNNAMNERYFYNYNTLNPNNKIYAPKGVSYILAIKKQH